LAFNFNKESETLTMDLSNPADERGAQAAPDAPQAPAAAQAPVAPVEESAAFVRFRSCRWHQPKENGSAEFCTHREVKPYAGTAGFDADAWCPDCQYYKLRRSPKKKTPGDDYGY
jgi:hypothetical protein